MSAHPAPALNEAAKAAVALGLAESVSPCVAEVALFLATARKLPAADSPDLFPGPRAMVAVSGSAA